MKTVSTYKVKIKHYNDIFRDTIDAYNNAVSYFVDIANAEWELISDLKFTNLKYNKIEQLTHPTKLNPNTKYNFDHANKSFLKMPAYLRRSAVSKALGIVSSYKSNLENFVKNGSLGNAPTLPKAYHSSPAMYKGGMYVRTDNYTARLKVWHRNDWIWLDVTLRKSDVDYIAHHMQNAKECVPTLRKRGRCYSLDFPFEQDAPSLSKEVKRILAVDLGLNNACTCVLMDSNGTVTHRDFLKLCKEQDQLSHNLGHIKKAQRHGAKKTPRLWAYVNGINKHITEETAQFIVNKAIEYNADTIVLEHLDVSGHKKHKSSRQRITLWKAKAVLSMVEHKAHLSGIRISTVNARNTSKLAFDGTGIVLRGSDLPDSPKKLYGNSYSICQFTTGKIYNCDLNAALNIGARYFIRLKQKSMSVTAWQALTAKVPSLALRSTCTLSDLIKLNAEALALVA